MPNPSKTELRAIDAIYSAYMACNSAYADDEERHASSLAYSFTPAPGVMGPLADAGRKAFRMLGYSAPVARLLWWAMCDGASGAEYVVKGHDDGWLTLANYRHNMW